MTALPPLLVGARRGLMARLSACATLYALGAIGTSLLVGRLVAAPDAQLGWLVLAMALSLALMAASKYAERVLAERLGQDYVHELRSRLVSSALEGERGPSLGITIARATNDLSSVRSWVAQGIAPLVAAVPLVLGSVAALGWLHWSLAAATFVPLVVLVLTLSLLARTAYRRARTLRRRRGRLASRLSDTLHARDAILSAGGQDRELRRIERDSHRVVTAAVARSRTAGALQAVALTTGAAIAALIALAGQSAGVDAAAVASALTIAGVLAAPLGETGRIVEFRQNYRAARRVLGPHLATAVVTTAKVDVQPIQQIRQVRSGRGTIQVHGHCRTKLPLAFSARAGDRLRLIGPDAALISATLRKLASPDQTGGLVVVIDGWDHTRLPPRRRRELVGLAGRDTTLERGTIARAVRYRRPDLDPTHTTAILQRVGLQQRVTEMPDGDRTELRRGGEPLAPADLARLKVARAVAGDPPLLLLDHIDSELDHAGQEMLARIVDAYPGVVVFASDQPRRVARHHRTLTLEDDSPASTGS